MYSSLLAALAAVLIRIGSHTEAGETTPLYAIMFGDTSAAEARSHAGLQFFGPNALDGDVWVREVCPADPCAWKKTSFRMPRGDKEIVAFFKHREKFTTDVYDVPKLPLADDALMERIAYVVAYSDGSSKVYLKPLTTSEDARRIAAALGASEEF